MKRLERNAIRFRPGLALALVALAAGSAHAVTVIEPDFTHADYVRVPRAVTDIAWAPDGPNRLFVAQQEGDIRIIKDGVLLSTPFVHAPAYSPANDSRCSECGLIGIAFNPNFGTNHFIYAFVTVSSSEQQIIRYTANGDVAAAGSQTILVRGLPTLGANHNGGGIGIGPDGKLYFSIGDNGNYIGVDNDTSSLASKVGRANLDGTPANDNPFFVDDGSVKPQDFIWARGFRNPFKMIFQPGTGDLWLNVVGSNKLDNGYEQIFVVDKGNHGGWNDYENNQPAGFLTPLIAYPTNRIESRTITSATRTANVARFTTSAPHLFRQGAKITINGVSNASFNGTVFVASVESATVFTASQTGTDASSSGGTASTQDIGGSVTGGCFYTGTAFPQTHRGNFFFGDYNSGRFLRVRLDSGNRPISVDNFVTGIGQYVDCAMGPDGALYYASVEGPIYRLSYDGATSQQSLVLSATTLSVVEGSSAAFSVRLAQAPGQTVQVTAVPSGDPSLAVTGGATLSFNSNDWNTPKTVTVTANEDSDATGGTGTITVSSNGLESETVAVRVQDNDTISLLLSASTLTIQEGGSGTFTARLSAAPPSPVTVTVSRSSGPTSITAAPGMLTFDGSNFGTPQTVTVSQATPDGDLVNNSAQIQLAATGGIATRTVSVTAVDVDGVAPAITSAPDTSAVVGAPYNYDVEATGNPAPTFSLGAPVPQGMTINATTGVISYTPSALGPVTVNVIATNALGSDTQTFTLEVVGDQPPACSLTEPQEGDIVAGQHAEFFGDGADDVSTIRAEFYVDGALKYTDWSDAGHFHYGGAHLLWDTTQLTDGAHTLEMRVFDTLEQTCSAIVHVSVNNLSLCQNVQCDPSDPCHSAGTCDPATGRCSNPALPDGTACGSTNSCSSPGTCQSGVCLTSSGGTPWCFDSQVASIAAPAVLPGRAVYTANNNGDVMALDIDPTNATQDGTRIEGWTDFTAPVGPIDGRLGLSPSTGTINFGSQDGCFYSINSSTGALNWWSGAGTFAGGSLPCDATTERLADRIVAAPVRAGDTVFVATRNTSTDSSTPLGDVNNMLWALNRTTGQCMWVFNGTCARGSGGRRIGIISSMPTLDLSHGCIYFTSRQAATNDDTVFAVRAASGGCNGPGGAGTAAWSINRIQSDDLGSIDASASLSRDGCTLYVGTNSGRVYALNTGVPGCSGQPGSPRWSGTGYFSTGSSAIFAESIWVEGSMLFFSLNTGSVVRVDDPGPNSPPPTSAVWSVGVSQPSLPVVINALGKVYVGSGDGKLHQIDMLNAAHATHTVDFSQPTPAKIGSPTVDITSCGGTPMSCRSYVGATSGTVSSVILPF